MVDSSPWLIAATHDLHRHLAPRHPPLALCSLKFRTLLSPSSGDEGQGATLHKKMLVLAMQFSKATPGSCRSRGCGTTHKREHALDRSCAARSAFRRVSTPRSAPPRSLRARLLSLRSTTRRSLPQNRAVNTRNHGSPVVPGNYTGVGANP